MTISFARSAGRLLVALIAARRREAFDVRDLEVARSSLHRDFHRDEVVASVAGSDLDDIAGLPELVHVLLQYDFHVSPSSIAAHSDNERDDGQVPRALDGLRQLALMDRADSADPPRQDLAALGDEVGEQLSVLVVDVGDLLGAELADAFAPD